MSNFRLKQPDAVFIHIPKTGGTSIRRGVWADNYDGPVFGAIPEEWSDLFSFAFVRHPFDRLISAWKMFSEGTTYGGNKCTPRPVLAEGVALKPFLRVVTNEAIPYDYLPGRVRTTETRIRHHTIPQTHPYNCLHLADFVGRYERFEMDYLVCVQRLGVTKPLVHMHRSVRSHWRDYMDAEDIELCAEFFRDDFRELGYALD